MLRACPEFVVCVEGLADFVIDMVGVLSVPMMPWLDKGPQLFTLFGLFKYCFGLLERFGAKVLVFGILEDYCRYFFHSGDGRGVAHHAAIVVMRGRVLCQASASFAGAQGEVQPEGAFEIFEEVRVEDVHLVLLYRLQVRLYLIDVEIPLYKRDPTLLVGLGAVVKSTLRVDMRPSPSAG